MSFEDGQVLKTLKRHLSARGMTIEDYRRKWGLPHDYPSVCPDYSAKRSELAFARGLGKDNNNAKAEKTVSNAKADTTGSEDDTASDAKTVSTKANTNSNEITKQDPAPKRVRSHPKSEQTRKRAPQGERAAAAGA